MKQSPLVVLIGSSLSEFELWLEVTHHDYIMYEFSAQTPEGLGRKTDWELCLQQIKQTCTLTHTGQLDSTGATFIRAVCSASE